MYIFEWIANYIKGKKYTKIQNFTPDEKEDITEKPQECEHLFMPIDSTNETLACKYCGLIIKIKNRRPE